MCNVTAGVAAATNILSTITDTASTIISEREKAKKVNEANFQSAKNAISEQLQKSNLEGIKEQQSRKKLNNEKLSLKIDNMQKKADLKSYAKSSGNAYNSLFRQLGINHGRNMSSIDESISMQELNSKFNRQNYRNNAINKISSLQEYTPKNPWLLGVNTGLKIGSSMFNAYKSYKGG